MAQQKPRLLASSPTLDGITALVNRFWCSSRYTVNPSTLAIEHPENQMTDYRITLKSGRYRFESINPA